MIAMQKSHAIYTRDSHSQLLYNIPNKQYSSFVNSICEGGKSQRRKSVNQLVKILTNETILIMKGNLWLV